MFYKRSRLSVALAVLLVLFMLAGCAGGSASNDDAPDDGAPDPTPVDGDNVIKIGVLLPLTGGDALDGQNQRFAHDLAADQINEAGGIASLGGAKIQLIYADSQGQPEIGNAEVERLITNEGVVAIMGAFHSGVTVSAQRIAERYQVPMLVPNALSNEITELGFEYTFKTVPRSSDYARDAGELLLAMNEEFGTEGMKVAVLHADNFIGKQMGEGWAEWLPQQGFEAVEQIAFDPSASNLQTEILRIRSANPDIIMSQANASEAILIVKTMKEMGYWPPYGLIGAGGGYSNPDTLNNLGSEAEHLFLVNDWFPNIARDRSEEINAAFRERYGNDMIGNANTSYAGTFVLAEAIEKAGSADPQAIRDSLATNTFDGPNITFMYDKVSFGADGMNEYAINVAAQVRDGVPMVVWPNHVRVIDPIWPAPNWDQR